MSSLSGEYVIKSKENCIKYVSIHLGSNAISNICMLFEWKEIYFTNDAKRT